MDYHYFNTDFADSLAFLSPAAQKNIRSDHSALSTDYSYTGDVLYTRRQSTYNQGCQRSSSSSFLLKKTRDKEIIEQYSSKYIRYRPKSYSKPIQSPKQRPLIRVTVIPNNYTCNQTKLRKRRPSAKKIQSTVSNHSSHFKAKNIFFVVGGNKGEEIYEIKTTGSEYSNGTLLVKDEGVPIEKNFQQLIYSLDMDKKKKTGKGKGKKDKNKPKDEDETGSSGSVLNLMENYGGLNSSVLRDCMCSPAIETLSPRKSKVRITGKIALTEDDRYVMRCAATIDGKPIDNNFFQDPCECPQKHKTQETQEPLPKMRSRPKERTSYSQKESMVKKESIRISHRDEITQTNIQNETSGRTNPCPAFMNTCTAFKNSYPPFRSVETQCSPNPNNINSICFSNIEQLKIFSSKDEVVQCNCPQDLVIDCKDVGIEPEYNKCANFTNSCNSPLVIISVYPKQHAEDKIDDEISSPKESYKGPSKEKVTGGKKKQGIKSRPSSPSPSKSPVKGKGEKKVEKLKGKDKGNKEKQPKTNKKGLKKEKTEQEKTIESPKRGTRSTERRQSGPQFAMAFSKCAECCVGCAGTWVGEGARRGTYTNKKQAMNWVSANNGSSNAVINIDGENEFYDVFLRQNDTTTDVQVRKTLKDDKFKHSEPEHGSLENLLQLSEQTRYTNRSLSETILYQPIADFDATKEQSVPGMNVRDSLEISHRREEKYSSDSITFPSSGSSSTNSETHFVNSKHFQGDSCDLPNPMDRDREIRQLLGIAKPHPSNTYNYEDFTANAEIDCQCSLHCFYRRQRPTDVSRFCNIREVMRFNEGKKDVELLVDENEIDYNHNDLYPHSFISCACRAEEKGYCEKPSKKTKSNMDASFTDRPFSYYIPYQRSTSSNHLQKKSRRDSGVPRKMCISKHPGRGGPCGAIVQRPEKIQNELSYDGEGYKYSYPPSSRHYENSSEEQKTSSSSGRQSDLILKPPLNQQLIMNRNINIFLQIEQFTKQKPIILSRKQYDKVKKIIENTALKKKSAVAKCICKSALSVLGSWEKKKAKLKKSSQKTSMKGNLSFVSHSDNQNLTENEVQTNFKNDCHEKQLRKTKESRLDEQPKINKVKKADEKKKSKNEMMAQCECNGEGDDLNFVSDTDNQKLAENERWRDCTNDCHKYYEEKQHRKTKESRLDEPPKIYEEKKADEKKKYKKNIMAQCECSGEEDLSFISDTDNQNLAENVRRRDCINDCHKYCEEKQHRKTKEWRLDEQTKIYEEKNEKKADDKEKSKKNIMAQCECSGGDSNFVSDTDSQKLAENVRWRDCKNGCHKYCEEKQHRKTKESRLDEQPKINEEKNEKKTYEKKKYKKNIMAQCECSGEGEDLSFISDTDNQKLAENERWRNYKNDCHKYCEEKQHRKTKESRLDEQPKINVVKSRNKADKNKKSKNKIMVQCECNREGEENLEKKENESGCRKNSRSDKDRGIFNFYKNDVPNICSRCGLYKASCDDRGRQNRTCVHTCYCYDETYDLKKENLGPSEQNLFLNYKLRKDNHFVASSTEVRYTSVVYANYKHVTFSSTNVANDNEQPPINNPVTKNMHCDSLHTIFKGPSRRTPTPNLGTSVYSLESEYSDANNSSKFQAAAKQPEERRPFLRRLMSCLVMRSKTSGVKIDVKPAHKPTSTKSSLDSYHINTSLGAIELSSSIYDTSASFYSNHSIQPISSKIKRGFLSSVREFLSYKKT